MRLAIIHFEANEAEIFEDVIRGTQETISHSGIFDSIKNAFFLAPLVCIAQDKQSTLKWIDFKECCTVYILLRILLYFVKPNTRKMELANINNGLHFCNNDVFANSVFVVKTTKWPCRVHSTLY